MKPLSSCRKRRDEQGKGARIRSFSLTGSLHFACSKQRRLLLHWYSGPLLSLLLWTLKTYWLRLDPEWLITRISTCKCTQRYDTFEELLACLSFTHTCTFHRKMNQLLVGRLNHVAPCLYGLRQREVRYRRGRKEQDVQALDMGRTVCRHDCCLFFWYVTSSRCTQWTDSKS